MKLPVFNGRRALAYAVAVLAVFTLVFANLVTAGFGSAWATQNPSDPNAIKYWLTGQTKSYRYDEAGNKIGDKVTTKGITGTVPYENDSDVTLSVNVVNPSEQPKDVKLFVESWGIALKLPQLEGIQVTAQNHNGSMIYTVNIKGLTPGKQVEIPFEVQGVNVQYNESQLFVTDVDLINYEGYYNIRGVPADQQLSLTLGSFYSIEAGEVHFVKDNKIYNPLSPNDSPLSGMEFDEILIPFAVYPTPEPEVSNEESYIFDLRDLEDDTQSWEFSVASASEFEGDPDSPGQLDPQIKDALKVEKLTGNMQGLVKVSFKHFEAEYVISLKASLKPAKDRRNLNDKYTPNVVNVQYWPLGKSRPLCSFELPQLKNGNDGSRAASFMPTIQHGCVSEGLRNVEVLKTAEVLDTENNPKDAPAQAGDIVKYTVEYRNWASFQAGEAPTSMEIPGSQSTGPVQLTIFDELQDVLDDADLVGSGRDAFTITGAGVDGSENLPEYVLDQWEEPANNPESETTVKTYTELYNSDGTNFGYIDSPTPEQKIEGKLARGYFLRIDLQPRSVVKITYKVKVKSDKDRASFKKPEWVAPTVMDGCKPMPEPTYTPNVMNNLVRSVNLEVPNPNSYYEKCYLVPQKGYPFTAFTSTPIKVLDAKKTVTVDNAKVNQKTGETGTTAKAGSELKYTVTFTNNSGSDLVNQEAWDLLDGVVDDATLDETSIKLADESGDPINGLTAKYNPDKKRIEVKGTFPKGTVGADGKLTPKVAKLTYTATVKTDKDRYESMNSTDTAAVKADNNAENFLVVLPDLAAGQTSEARAQAAEKNLPDSGSCQSGMDNCTTTLLPLMTLEVNADPTSGTQVETGGNVAYTTTVKNIGKAAGDFEATAYLEDLLKNSTMKTDSSNMLLTGDVINGSIVAGTDGNKVLKGALPAPTSGAVAPKADFKFTVKVNDKKHRTNADRQDWLDYQAALKGASRPVIGADPQPFGTGQASHPIKTEPHFTLSKLAKGEGVPLQEGSKVNYQVTVTNTGDGDGDFSVVDLLDEVLFSAKDQKLVEGSLKTSCDQGQVAFKNVEGKKFIVATGHLAHGKSCNVIYQVELARPEGKADGDQVVLNNKVTFGVNPPATDPDCNVTDGSVACTSTAWKLPEPEPTPTPEPVRDLTVTKSVVVDNADINRKTGESGTTAKAGSELKYTVTFTNKSTGEFANEEYWDLLSGVLDDADLVEGSIKLVGQDGSPVAGLKASFNEADQRIEVKGTLPKAPVDADGKVQSQVFVLTYSVTVKTDEERYTSMKSGEEGAADNNAENFVIVLPELKIGEDSAQRSLQASQSLPKPGSCTPQLDDDLLNRCTSTDLPLFVIQLQAEPDDASMYRAGQDIEYTTVVRNVGRATGDFVLNGYWKSLKENAVLKDPETAPFVNINGKNEVAEKTVSEGKDFFTVRGTLAPQTTDGSRAAGDNVALARFSVTIKPDGERKTDEIKYVTGFSYVPEETADVDKPPFGAARALNTMAQPEVEPDRDPKPTPETDPEPNPTPEVDSEKPEPNKPILAKTGSDASTIGLEALVIIAFGAALVWMRKTRNWSNR